MRASAAALAFAALSWLAPASAHAETPPPPKVDMERMYGGWYMIATLPNWFEKGMVALRNPLIFKFASFGSFRAIARLKKTQRRVSRRRPTPSRAAGIHFSGNHRLA